MGVCSICLSNQRIKKYDEFSTLKKHKHMWIFSLKINLGGSSTNHLEIQNSKMNNVLVEKRWIYLWDDNIYKIKFNRKGH